MAWHWQPNLWHCGVRWWYISQFSLKNSWGTPHRLPVRARYGVSFVVEKSDRSFTIVTAGLCAVSCGKWPWYISSLQYWGYGIYAQGWYFKVKVCSTKLTLPYHVEFSHKTGQWKNMWCCYWHIWVISSLETHEYYTIILILKNNFNSHELSEIDRYWYPVNSGHVLN